jgi:hypothetical protein
MTIFGCCKQEISRTHCSTGSFDSELDTRPTLCSQASGHLKSLVVPNGRVSEYLSQGDNFPVIINSVLLTRDF